MLQMTEQQRRIFDEYRNNPHAYPEEAKMSDARLLKRVDELIEEMQWPVTFIDKTVREPSFMPEILLFLLGRNSLSGFYMQLKLLNWLKVLDTLSQEELRGFTGLSSATFNRYKKGLVKLGVIGETQEGHSKRIVFYPSERLPYIKPPREFKEFLKWLQEIKKKIVMMTPSRLKEIELIESKEQAQLALEGMVDAKVQEREKKRLEVKKREEQKFPNEDYELVINAFKKYRKVGLIGPEINRAKHAIKQMFLAKRTPQQIIGCMAFFSEHQGEEDYRWLSNWTLETVMKKMPEFVAGQLRTNRIGDDIKQV